MAIRTFTSESVTEGHPDKLCDQISDAVLDAHLAQDPMARVACETISTTGMILLMGEITSKAQVDYQAVARETALSIGYDNAEYGLDGAHCSVMVTLGQQSPDIAMGVNSALEGRSQGALDIGAGDQGMMFGYACDETPSLMPMPVELSHRLAREFAVLRKSGKLGWLRPDGKSQVTVRYEDDIPAHIDSVVISMQHDPDISLGDLQAAIKKEAVALLPKDLVDDGTVFFINPTGRFVIGGPHGDSGLTGRKIIVDTYGGYACHGGGAFSGKDPTKVDRSASYMARYVAKNIVAAKLAKRCQIELAYAIGVAKPVSVLVDTFGTGSCSDDALCDLVKKTFDLRPAAIIERLNLRRPIYRQTAAYGHFGRSDLALPWEELTAANELRA